MEMIVIDAEEFEEYEDDDDYEDFDTTAELDLENNYYFEDEEDTNDDI